MPGFSQKGVKTLPCVICIFLLLPSHRYFCNPCTLSESLSAHCVFSLFMSISACVCVCIYIYLLSAHVLCVYMHVTELGLYASSLSSCVPNWLWHICGFSRRIRAGAKLPRNQCNRLCSPSFPPHIPPFSSVCPPCSLSFSLSLSLLSPFFLPLSCLEPLLKMEWVCAAYLKWSWMDLNGWWYLVSPQGAAMSP